MDYNFYKCAIKDYDYCIFLENSTLACYLDQLSEMSFRKTKVIVDQLFYTGNKENRFVVFETSNKKIVFNSAKNIKLNNRIQNEIDSIVLLKYSQLCKHYLSKYDYEKMQDYERFNLACNK